MPTVQELAAMTTEDLEAERKRTREAMAGIIITTIHRNGTTTTEEY